MTPPIITVLIVEDHPLFREGLRSAIDLEDDIAVLGECGDGEEAVRLIRELKPRVVLMDINLPGKNGLQITRLVKTEQPEIAVILLTAYHDVEQVLHAMRSGASAYCPKDVTPQRLVEIIHEAVDGFYIVDDERMGADALQGWMTMTLQAFTGAYALDPNEHFVPLSPREMEILQFVTQGLSNKEIAHHLSISQQTVKNHMTSILKKLNVQDRTQAAMTAVKHGWVRLQNGLGGGRLS